VTRWLQRQGGFQNLVLVTRELTECRGPTTDGRIKGHVYRGADKSLARPGKKQATATKLELLQATQRKFRSLSVQPGLRSSNDLRVRLKMATFQLFFQSGLVKDLSASLYANL